jgi:anaerobic ribonucleoside-triphosphate reductase
MKMVDIANKQLGGENACCLSSVYNNVYPVRICSKKLVAFIQKWTNWKEETYYYNKELNLDCLLQSVEFRKGILDGWYNTDGGNSNRCYTTSKKLVECMESLVTSLGMQSIIDVSDKTDEKVIIRGVEYNRNYPLYCLRWYAKANHRQNKDIEHTWIKKNNSIYFKIKSIIKVDDYEDDVYCIECNNEKEPYFTLPCGLITHNCRLRNSLKDNELDEEHNHTTHQFSMGTASVATGSKSVMTINLNRVIQNATRKYLEEVEYFKLEDNKQYDINNVADKEKLYEYISNGITEITERVHKYQRAFNEIIKDFYNAQMLDVYSAGYISMKKQYLTIGVNGLTDAAEFLCIEPNLNENYKEFVNNILETINKSNRKDRTRDCMYNTEFVPGENLSNKNYNWDKKDGYYVSPKHIMYSSYFFNPEDTSLSILDKMKLHGNDFVKYLDGGQACHLNINEHLSFAQYRELLKVASKYGCSYFTFNCKNTVCNDCGYISKDTLDKCPKCESENLDYLTRIIGYLKRVSSFAEARQTEEKMRYYNND